MAYNGRRGPNVSEFVANLNAIPTAQDLQSSNQENFNLDEDLAMFTNTQFFDFDLGQDADLQLPSYDGREGEAVSGEEANMKPLDFLQDSFTYPDFNNFTQSAPVFPNNGVAPPPMAPNQPMYAMSSGAASPSSAPTPSSGTKRKADSPAETLEDASRVAAEEDKRRRNTAASARFRVKKKQREQALEKSAKDMSDKVAALEGRINQLETENKWLKNLITEKNESKEDIAALYKKYSQEQSERKGSERKDGVGTKA